MKYKEITLRIRTQHLLRGEKPCVVCVPKNNGKIYTGTKDEHYVMTITKDKMLYFHGLTKWTKSYKPEMDFKIKIEALSEYTKEDLNKTTTLYTFSTKEGLYFPIRVFHSVSATYETDNNLEVILRKIRNLGVKEVRLFEE